MGGLFQYNFWNNPFYLIEISGEFCTSHRTPNSSHRTKDYCGAVFLGTVDCWELLGALTSFAYGGEVRFSCF